MVWSGVATTHASRGLLASLFSQLQSGDTGESGSYAQRVCRWRIAEALALTESHSDANTGSVLVREGTCGERRKVGLEEWSSSAGTAPDQLPIGRSSAFALHARLWQG